MRRTGGFRTLQRSRRPRQQGRRSRGELVQVAGSPGDNEGGSNDDEGGWTCVGTCSDDILRGLRGAGGEGGGGEVAGDVVVAEGDGAGVFVVEDCGEGGATVEERSGWLAF